MLKLFYSYFLIFYLFSGHHVYALPKHAAKKCRQLNAKDKTRAIALFRTLHAYDYCDERLEQCLTSKTPNPLVVKMSAAICRLIAKGKRDSEIISLFNARGRLVTQMEKSVVIKTPGWPRVGPEKTKVEVVEYACARCPFCSKITPKLHQALTKGKLKDRVRLVFKPFPIRNHKWSKESGLAFVAAHQMKAFWPFALHLYAHFDRYSPDKERLWARRIGLSCDRFAELTADGRTRKKLIESKKEGLRNGVKATPTFFVNGRRYDGAMDSEELIDTLDEIAIRAEKGL